MKRNRTYSEMMSFDTFEDRYEYLKVTSSVGLPTFGSSRYMNQMFYRSPEWKRTRDSIILRDNGCDLAVEDRIILSKILIHHLNPITEDDVRLRNYVVFDPENLVCVSFNTHQAIHYSNSTILVHDPIVRTKNDTIPWK